MSHRTICTYTGFLGNILKYLVVSLVLLVCVLNVTCGDVGQYIPLHIMDSTIYQRSMKRRTTHYCVQPGRRGSRLLSHTLLTIS